MNDKNINFEHYKLLKEFKKEYPTIKDTILEIYYGDILKLFDEIDKVLSENNIIALRFLLAELYELYDIYNLENDCFNKLKEIKL